MSSEWHDKARRAQDELRAGTEILLDLMKTARSGSTSLEAVEGRTRGDEPTMPTGEVQDEILEALDKIATVRRFVEYSVLREELAEKRAEKAAPSATTPAPHGTAENPCDERDALAALKGIVDMARKRSADLVVDLFNSKTDGRELRDQIIWDAVQVMADLAEIEVTIHGGEIVAEAVERAGGVRASTSSGAAS